MQRSLKLFRSLSIVNNRIYIKIQSTNIMEARKQPSRKARDEAVVRKVEEIATKVSKKRPTPDTEDKSKKREKKAKSEDTDTSEASTSKKGAKAASKAKSETTSSIAKTNGDSKKAASSKVKNSTKSKTDDDIKPAVKETKGKSKEVRRSRSAEPMTTSNGAKKKVEKKDVAAIAEEPKKGGRGKKTAAKKPDDDIEEEAEEVPKASGNGKRGSPSADDGAPPVKKGRGGKKAAAKLSSEEEEGSLSADDESPPVKKGRGGKKAEAKLSSEEAGSLSADDESPPVKKGRGGKKAAAKPSSEEAGSLSANDESPPVKKGRGGKKAAAKLNSEDEDNDDDDAAADDEPAAKGEKKLLNSVNTNYDDIDFGIKEKFNLKIASWNVGGLRALIKKNPEYFTKEEADIICMNEIKCGSLKEIPEEYKIEGYHAYWNMGKGFGGVGLLSKMEPIEVTYDLPDTDFSDEKRLITAEFEKFYVVSVYVVNSGRGLKTLEKRLEWNAVFDTYIQSLDKKKPVIIAGDMNVSHKEIDLTNPKPNKKNAGFTAEEREGFDKLLSMGFVDTFRHFYPELTGAYTFWSYMNNARSKNVGWRLDYFLVSERFMDNVKDNVIRSTVLGSDHCPIVLFLNL